MAAALFLLLKHFYLFFLRTEMLVLSKLEFELEVKIPVGKPALHIGYLGSLGLLTILASC